MRASLCMEMRTTLRSCFLNKVLEQMPAGQGFFCSASGISLARSNCAILSIMVPSCWEVVMETLLYWLRVYSFQWERGDGAWVARRGGRLLPILMFRCGSRLRRRKNDFEEWISDYDDDSGGWFWAGEQRAVCGGGGGGVADSFGVHCS